jgi:hypothetical protein
MAEGRQRANWAQTASVMALLANCHRDPKRSRAFRPSDFDPFARSAAANVVVTDGGNVELMEKAFTGKTERKLT